MKREAPEPHLPPIPDYKLIQGSLAAIAAERRPWTPRELIHATAKAGGWTSAEVAACLYHYGTDGYL